MKCILPLDVGSPGVAWHFPRGARKRVPPHHHEELEANLVISGSATYFVGGERVELHPGSIIWLFPAQEHVLTDVDPDFCMWIMVFRQGLVRTVAVNAPKLTMDDPGSVVTKVLPNQRVRLLDMVAHEIAGETPLGRRFSVGLTWWLLSAWEACERDEEAGRPFLHPAVARAVELLRSDPGADLSALSRAVGLSPSQLSRLFSQQVGLNLSRFRNRLRLEAFFDEYESGRARTMLDAALNARFGSYAQFSRVFRQHMGCGPSAYGKAARKMHHRDVRRLLAG